MVLLLYEHICTSTSHGIFHLSNGQNRIHPEARWPNPGTPSHATRLWPDFKRVSLILATHPPSATRFQSHLPDYGRDICTVFTFLWAKKIRQLKNYIIIAPPQHDTLRCFLDVDSFQGGSFNLSENISDLISIKFYCLNSPQGRRLSVSYTHLTLPTICSV